MWVSAVLIIIATLAGLLSLWREEIVSLKGNTEKKSKTIRLKFLSSVFIFLTLCFTIYKIIKSNNDAITAEKEKIRQFKIDSIRYAKDSIKYIEQREEDRKTYKKIDSIREIQIKAYEAQILAGKTVDNIKSKSESIINNLLRVDSTLSRNNKTLNESAEYALNSFQELSTSSQRLLYLLDDNIKIDFSFGFRSLKTEEKIEEYIRNSGIIGDYIKIDEKFPFYLEIQEVLSNVELSVKFYNKNNEAKMINHETGAVMYNYIDTPAMLYLRNKKPMIFIPYKKKVRENLKLIYIEKLPDGYFNMLYHVPSKSFFFTSDELSMSIVGRQDQYFSILDYDNTIALLELKTPETRDNPNCFFNLNSSYISFNINFSNKKSTKYYKHIKPLNFYGNDIWPGFFIEKILLYE